MPTPGQGYVNSAITSVNTALSPSDMTVNMWTDNAITNTLGAFVLAGLAATFY